MYASQESPNDIIIYDAVTMAIGMVNTIYPKSEGVFSWELNQVLYILPTRLFVFFL